MDNKEQQAFDVGNQALNQDKNVVTYLSDNYTLTEQDDWDFILYYLQLNGHQILNQHPEKYKENSNK